MIEIFLEHLVKLWKIFKLIIKRLCGLNIFHSLTKLFHSMTKLEMAYFCLNSL